MLETIRKCVLTLDTPERSKVIRDAYFWPFQVIQSFSMENNKMIRKCPGFTPDALERSTV